MGERPSRFLCLGNLMKIKRADFKEASFKPSSCESEQFCGGLLRFERNRKANFLHRPAAIICKYISLRENSLDFNYFIGLNV